MQYDLSLFPVSDDDQPLKDETGKPSNFRKTLITLCAADVDGDGQPVKGTEKVKRFEIYMKLKAATRVVDLSSDEVGLLSQAALAFPTIIAGQVRYFLDQKPPFGAYVPDSP